MNIIFLNPLSLLGNKINCICPISVLEGINFYQPNELKQVKKKIKVAILTRGKGINLWQQSVIQDIENSYYAEFALHIVIENCTGSKIPLAWKLFSRLDFLLFRPNPNALGPALENGGTLFKKALIYSTIEEINTSELRDYRYDVLINFSDIVPTKYIISSFKYGVWNLAYYNHKNTKQGPPGAWELKENHREITASLCYISKEMLYPTILDQTIACTDWISYSRNANIIYWQAASLINKNLKILFEYGNLERLGCNSTSSTTPLAYCIIPFEYPNTKLIFWHIVKTLLKKLSQLFESKIYFNQWILLFKNIPGTSPYNMSQYKRILPPKDRFWADPFIIKRNGKYYLFIEELIYKNKLGHLAVMELDEKGNYTTPKVILKKDYHLSYPFLIEDNGNLYMIPETGENKDIQLYKCTNFPYEWQLEKVIMEDVVALDTTIYKKDNLYWMFTNLKMHKGMSSNVELFLFSSKELVSDQWTPHPLNPIVTNINKSRSAGNIYLEGDKLIRPSQNCSQHYGFGMSINIITKLKDKCFMEEIKHPIAPGWSNDVLCTHTFNSCDSINISDAQIKRRRLF